MNISRFLIGLTAFLVMLLSFLSHADELSRSTLLGIVPEQTQTGQNVVLQRVAANSTASTLGLKPGDKIVSINNQPIADFSSLLEVIRPIKAAQSILVTIERNNKTLVKSGTMQPRPYELSEHAEVYYESVSYLGNKLRSITYKPNHLVQDQQAPAIFFIQGYTCDSIDMGMMPEATTKQLVEQFAQAGYVVFRVEKPGVGDSQSEKHCSEIDFTTEATAFTEALRSLKQKSYVDPDQVYLWGHSLGVLHSAVVANHEPVAGIIGFGGVLKNWYEYMLDIYRHQSVKHFGTSVERANRNTKLVQPVLDMWLNSDKHWEEVTNHNATKAAIEAGMIDVNGDQIINRHYSFFRDLNKYDLAQYWQKLNIPLLMMHGSLDIQAIEKKWAFDLVSLSKNPHSTALEIEGAEHAFMRYESASQYMRARNNRTYNPAQPGEYFDTRIGQHTLDWLAETRKQSSLSTPQFSGINHIKYKNGSDDKTFVGNGFLIEYKTKIYAVTVKHVLLEAKTENMNSVSINEHISEWRIHPNNSPSQYIKLGRLMNEAKLEPLDMKILSKDWLIFEVEENHSNLRVLKLRNSTLQKGEILTAFGCSYSVKEACIQDTHQGTFLASTKTNLRIEIPDLNIGNLRGLSGSPVLDSNKQLVGIVSNIIPSESGEGFDFAPANLDYLMTELEKLAD